MTVTREQQVELKEHLQGPDGEPTRLSQVSGDAPSRQRVMIVDDSKENIKILSTLLREEAEILFAMDGETALRKIKEYPPDIILLDVQMPGMDGHDVCRALKNDPDTENIPVIFITGLGNEDDEEFGLSLGAIDYIAKPFSPSIVQVRVKNHLAFQRLNRDLKLANKELTRLATTDFLTGVYNRRRFLELANAEIQRLKRMGHSFGVIMADIDKFKSVNDTYGHDVGDKVLIAMAQTCVNTLRDVDVVGRLGGEEFAMVLPETDLEGTELVAERLREILSEIKVPVGDVTITFTVSAGITVVSDMKDSIDNALKRADEALYEAKEGGRNQVVTARGDRETSS
jgi:diguanylate cyclase (GGDEF)-like protein